MSAVVTLQGLLAGELVLAELRLQPGLNPILARPALGATLVALLVGQHKNRTGTVTVAGRDPRHSPALRARMPALFAVEPKLPGRTLRDGLSASLGGSDAADRALAAAGLRSWGQRPASRLSPEERRSVALATALAWKDPLLMALYDPLANTPGIDRDWVVGRLRELGEAGVTVVAATASVRDALALGGDPWVLAQGSAHRVGTTTASPAGGGETTLMVECAAARRLGGLLLGHPDVLGLGYDEIAAPRRLLVHARTLRSGSLAITSGATTLGVSLSALRPEPPTLARMETTAAAAARAATPPRPLAPTDPSAGWTVAKPFGLEPPPPPPPPPPLAPADPTSEEQDASDLHHATDDGAAPVATTERERGA